MGKSSKHKTQNTHHFISFSERISNVNVDVIHLIRKVHDDETDEGTYFGEALSKWTDLDLTDHYTSFRREISGQVQTFEQLVHHKEKIISLLKTHLAVENSLALNALLDLVVQLARDLQQDFVPHFSEFFDILIKILNSRSQDVEAMEQTFQTLAFLFRVLWRFLIKNMEQIFGYYSDLLQSRKEYIRVFAAESCAYLLRKIKKRDELLNFLFKSLKKAPQLTEGVGLLLFEMMKGVKFHFHTVCNEIFPIMLSKLGAADASDKVKLPLNLVEEAVTVVMQRCAEHTNKEHSKPIWDMLMSAVTNAHSLCLKESGESDGAEDTDHKAPATVTHLARLLRLTSIWLDHNDGSIVSNPDQVAKVLMIILKNIPHPENLGSDLLDTLIKLFSSCQDRLATDVVVKLTTAIFSSAFLFTDLRNFLMSTLDMPFFEKDILTGCMNRIHFELPLRNAHQKEEVVKFIVELVLSKTGSPVTGEDLHLLKCYPLDQITHGRTSKTNSFCQYIEDTLASLQENNLMMSSADLANIWAVVVCLPHLSISDSADKIKPVWNMALNQLKNCQTDQHSDILYGVINQLMKTMIILKKDQEEPMPFSCEDVMDVLKRDPSNLMLLQTADFFFSCPSSCSHLTSGRLMEIYKQVEPNFVSPSHTIRLLTCHLLSLFPVVLPDYNDDIKRVDVFTTLLSSEKMIPTVHNYREKLIYLRRLEHDMVTKCLPDMAFSQAPLLYLLGNEHWNFKFLWQPLSEMIATHAQAMETNDFWNIMLGQLRKAAAESEKELQVTDSSSLVKSDNEQGSLLCLFTDHVTSVLEDSRKPDYMNYRIQLWKAMKKFPEKCILRSDELCTLYLNLLRNEFASVDTDAQMYQSIKSEETSDPGEINVVDRAQEEITDPETIEVDIEDDDDKMDLTLTDTDKKRAQRRKRPNDLSLLVHLDLFALFKKQRSLFNKPETQDTFYELLKNRNSTIQKAAFDCIVTYKSPHILPYRENFNRLLDDETFKSEIVLFRINEENSQVQEKDREGFLPVLMRILYGKMHGKAGKDTSGAANSKIRKKIVFGFLGGCKPEELRYFLTLLFQPCFYFVTENPIAMVEEAKEVDLKKMIPLKKIKGVLDTVDTVLNKLGHQLEKFSHPLLHMLLGLATMLNSALERRSQVVKGALNLLKTLRHTTVIRITQFLEYYEDLDFTSQELDALFHAVVWPSAEKLVLEGVHHPTPLLKLFEFWSKSQRMIPLLGYCKESDVTPGTGVIVNPLSCMFDLLNAPTLTSDVAAVVLDIVQTVLNFEQEEEDGSNKMPDLPEAFQISDPEGKGLGEVFIAPYVPQLLKYLQKALNKLVNGSAKKKQSFILELKILASVSHFVTLPNECKTLCDLLIPYLASGRSLPEQMEENTLTSITNLMEHVADPQVFYRPVSQLFSSVDRRASRSLLCKLFKVINKEDSFKLSLADTIEKLNSWDKRKAEEPDYTTRLEAFHGVNALISAEDEPDINVLLPVVYNCCYFIHAVDDLSIRDNSTHCLTNIVEKLSSVQSEKNTKAFNVVLEKCLVVQVKMGIRSKSEAVRHEYLAVLQSLVNKYPSHQMFTGLSKLCDKDPEADFFENIRHIQMHKRSRALRRLFKHLKDHHMTPDIHMTYFIPLIYAFITDSSYAKYANVQDAAVDLLGAICKQLPWQHYIKLLQFYLKLLPKKEETQQIIRIIVALLDGFHYDLNKSTFKAFYNPKFTKKNTGDAENDDVAKPENETNPSADTENVLEAVDEEDMETDALPLDMNVTEDVDQSELTAQQSEEPTNGKLICSAAAATRIHKTLITVLLPQLHNVITQKAKGDDVHKVNKSKYPEDDEILRVPIALAMIKLLQQLPKGTLESKLPGILLKICNFLRSRSKDIRVSARETLQKAAMSLGTRFFPFIIKELQSALTRGYQLHVLGFTTHYLLHGLQSIFTPGDLDAAVGKIQAVYHNELFGVVAEEKEVAAIKAKYFEAKSVKAYDAYELLAKYISSSKLYEIIKPVKEMLETTSNRKIANKVENLLRKVSDGLMANPAIDVKTMMVFVHSLTAKVMEQSNVTKQEKIGNDTKEGRMPESCLLLQAAAPRAGHKPKANKKTNAHIIVEFGLQLLNSCLKRSALLPDELPHIEMLDPFVVILEKCLNSDYVKTNSMAVRCLSWVLKFPLPSLKSNIVKIVEGMFVVLQNYVGSGSSAGGNQELITMCFKAVTVLVRDVTYHQITTEQLQVLLTYCEEDLYNYSRQSTAFNLIKAILSRKLDVPQLHQVMDKLFEMTIVSQASHIRLQSRQVVLSYMMNYPLGKNMQKNLLFYINHLQFELEDGRMSAIEMMISIFTNFPEKILNTNYMKFFSPLSMALHNDSSIKCRKLLSVALKALLGKVDAKCRKVMFLEIVKWMKSDKIPVRTMGCHVCGVLVEVQGGKIEKNLDDIVPLLQQQMEPDRFATDEENEENDELIEQRDMNLLALLCLTTKITRELEITHNLKFVEDMDLIWSHVLSHQLYPHAPVRLAACQLAGLFFSAWDPAEVARFNSEKQPCENKLEPLKNSYFLKNCSSLIRSFGKAFCQQLQAPALDEALATQVVKNLLYLARLAESLKSLDELSWLGRKIVREANHEVIHNVKVTSKRTFVFKWVAAIGVTLEAKSVEVLLPVALPVLQREMSDGTQDEEFNNLVQEVLDLLKKQVGVEVFTSAYAKSHKQRAEKKDDRKRKLAAEAVTDPEIAARKKIKHHLKKREAKKRRNEDKKPAIKKKRISKNKLSILNVKVDDD